MAFMWLLLAIALGLCVGTVRALFNDGRPLRPPASHLQDPLFVAPGRQIEQPPRGAVLYSDAWLPTQRPVSSVGPPPEILQIGRHGRRAAQ
ncbi:hypothetical protein [Nocardioides furvisabuli]|uniref:Uncharacterized protein n=1 Tax=Nocardioides furvisabuli TaxID=375542 RepID=A0ABN2XHW0_9ACTN|nr:hypothetical protein [Nocardioides furvisabuli]